MPSPPRRNNGYQYGHGQYNSNNNRHDYSGPYENNNVYKRSRYDGPPEHMDYYNNNHFPIEHNQYFDNKKSRRDW